MPRIRVLIVDDSVVIRKIVTDALSVDPMIEVVGTASNGRLALSRIQQVNPDLVTLDIEMPEMNGLEALKEIRKTHPNLPVVMFSTLTERGGMATLEALSLGASDYVTKPSNMGSVVAAQQRVREELVPKIRALCWRVAGLAASAGVSKPLSTATSSLAIKNPSVSEAKRLARLPGSLPPRIDLIAIGVSTGGPNALAEILPKLPANLPVPIVIVQHMPPLFTKLLADRLNAECALRVEEGVAGRTLVAGTVYIAPGNFHMTVKNEGGTLRLGTNQAPPENSCRPAVDVLFKSVAQTVGANTLAIVLTGMGRDGLRGCEYIAEVGGTVFAQDQNSSVVWGMPGFVANAGLADRILPLNKIAGDVVQRVRERRTEFSAAAPAIAPRLAHKG